MTICRVDPGLPLPGDPPDIPTLGTSPPGLAIASPGGGPPAPVAGERALVSHRSAPRSRTVWIDGLEAVTALTVDNGQVANRVFSPGLLRSEFVDARGTSLESLLVTRTLPLVVLQWAGSSEAPRLLRLRLPARGALQYRAARGRLSAFRPDESGDVLCLTLDPPPERWVIEPRSDGGLDVHAEVSLSTRPTLLIARTPPAKTPTLWAAAAHLGAHEQRAGEGWSEGVLELRSGVPEIDDGVAWLCARIASAQALRPKPAAEASSDLLLTGVGAIAAGHHEVASVTLGRLQTQGFGGDATALAAAGVLAGRLALATGHTQAALEVAREILSRGDPSSDPRTDPRLNRAAGETLADGLHRGAPPEVISALRASATTSVAPGSANRSSVGRPLPLVSQSVRPPTPLSWVSRALTGDPPNEGPADELPEPDPTGSETSDLQRRALAAWADFGHDPARAWTTWRDMLAAGLAKGPAGPGTWDGWDAFERGVAPTAGLMAAALVHGLFGVSPDAPAGRLRLAPRLPGHLTRFDVVGLALASTRIGLSYRKHGAVHRYRLDPTVSRVPPLVLFEPTVAGTVKRVSIDGEPAELDATPLVGGTRVSVQIPIDSNRTVEIEEI